MIVSWFIGFIILAPLSAYVYLKFLTFIRKGEEIDTTEREAIAIGSFFFGLLWPATILMFLAGLACLGPLALAYWVVSK